MLKYIELKTTSPDDARAWVARVRASKSGSTLYFDGKALSRVHKPSANHEDRATGEAYWISEIKSGGFDRRWAGAAKVAIETGAIEEFLRITGIEELDPARFEVIADLPQTGPTGDVKR